jgi:hypothetical protein
MLIHKKGLAILLSGQYRAFLKYANVFSISVSHFLKEERCDINFNLSRESFARIIPDFGTALMNLHEQFSWPYLGTI